MPYTDELDAFLRASTPQGGVPNKDVFESVWKIVVECGEEERHFNQLQSVYRGVASTWLLATFGAVGYLMFDKDGHVAHPALAGAVCLLGALGVGLLWFLDLNVYYRMLNAVFYEGKNLELKYPWLPQIRLSMIKHAGNVRNKLAWYYFFTTAVPLVAGIAMFLYYRFFYQGAVAGVLGATVTAILLVKTRKGIQ